MSFVWSEPNGIRVCERLIIYIGSFWQDLDNAPVASAGIPYGDSLLDIIATLAGTDFKQELFFDWLGSGAPAFLLDASYGPFQHISAAFARKWPPPSVWLRFGSPQPAFTLATRHAGLVPKDAIPNSEIALARLLQNKNRRRVFRPVHKVENQITGKLIKKRIVRVQYVAEKGVFRKKSG